MKGLYSAKAWYTRRLARVVRWCTKHHTSPNTLTALGVVSAGLGGIAIAYGWWPLATLLIAGRLAGANLDGAVARARDIENPNGYVINELGDRVSDLLLGAGLIGAVYLTPGANHAWAWIAVLAATLPTTMSLAIAGAGGPRINGGPVGKTERCLAYAIAAVLAALNWGNALTVLCIVVTVGSFATALLRWRQGSNYLTGEQQPDKGNPQ